MYVAAAKLYGFFIDGDYELIHDMKLLNPQAWIQTRWNIGNVLHESDASCETYI